jgi:hypothetical protein
MTGPEGEDIFRVEASLRKQRFNEALKEVEIIPGDQGERIRSALNDSFPEEAELVRKEQQLKDYQEALKELDRQFQFSNEMSLEQKAADPSSVMDQSRYEQVKAELKDTFEVD